MIRPPPRSTLFPSPPPSRSDAHPRHARQAGGPDARRRVLYDQAVLRGDAEKFGGLQVTLGSRLAVLHVFGAHDDPGNRQAGVAHPGGRDSACPRGDYRPALGGGGGEQIRSSLDLQDVRGVLKLDPLELPRLRIRVEVGGEGAEGLFRPSPVGELDDLRGVQVVALGPYPPGSLYRGRRVHEHAVEVEQYGLAPEPIHQVRVLTKCPALSGSPVALSTVSRQSS